MVQAKGQARKNPKYLGRSDTSRLEIGGGSSLFYRATSAQLVTWKPFLVLADIGPASQKEYLARFCVVLLFCLVSVLRCDTQKVQPPTVDALQPFDACVCLLHLLH